MNAHAPAAPPTVPTVQRNEKGHLLPGARLNPGGRPVGSITDFRARFQPYMAEVAETLLALMRSPNESTRLSAVREILDRVLGRAAIAIDTTHTRVDVQAMYLQALKQANAPAQIDLDHSHVLPTQETLGTKDAGSACGTETS
jgi:hypothetical protein